MLTDGTSKVEIGNNYSETLNILWYSVVLGPLLFLLFINDLPNDIKSETRLFADDIKLLAWLLSKETTQI